MRKMTTTEFVDKARQIHAGSDYDYSETVYKDSHSQITYTCPTHGRVQNSATNHLCGKGCPACRPTKASNTRSMGTSKFIEKASKTHQNRYSYSAVQCHGVASKVEIICDKHGSFFQTAVVHLRGHGCPKCWEERRALVYRSTLEYFITHARMVHGDRYDYTLTSYQKAMDPVTIVCPQHGPFTQSADSHLAGHGCPKCYQQRAGDDRRHTQESYVKAAQNVHPGKYTYDLTGYRNRYSYINITCPTHGTWTTQAKHHLSGQGCPACAVHDSKGETELFEWVKGLCPDAVPRTRQIIPPKELDIAVPAKRIAVEYNGTYWHSNDPLFPKNTLSDFKKYTECQKAGYRLFIVWEHDWKAKPGVIKHWLLHKLGRANRICGARQTKVEFPTSLEAKEFYTKFHLQGAPSSNVITLGLKFNDQWVAMASFSKSAERNMHLPEHEYYFSRLAFAGSVPGAASKIFKALVRHTQATVVHAHSDNSYAEGDVKALLQFRPEGQLDPRYRVWHPKFGIRHRTFWQKKNIQKRLYSLGKDLVFNPLEQTTFDGHRLCGCRHVWDCGKTKWIWKSNFTNEIGS
jgi:hypothetical protein